LPGVYKTQIRPKCRCADLQMCGCADVGGLIVHGSWFMAGEDRGKSIVAAHVRHRTEITCPWHE